MPEWADVSAIVAAVVAIGGVGYWVGKVNSNQKSFRVFTSEVRDDIKALREDVKEIFL